MTALSVRELKFVNNVALGMSLAMAAREAGYSDTYARKSSSNLVKRAAIATAIEEAKKRVVETVCVDAAAMNVKINTALDKATAANQYSAVAKLLDLQARLAGLVKPPEIPPPQIDVSIALSEAHERAGRRVVDVSPVSDAPGEPSLRDALRRPPSIFTD